ncbi:hypothetical protein Tco_1316269 [Tanacetum coccineum]
MKEALHTPRQVTGSIILLSVSGMMIADIDRLDITLALDYIEMEMQIPRSSIVKFIATCSYSRLNDFKTSRKNDPKLPQTLISTSSSVCQSDEVMN